MKVRFYSYKPEAEGVDFKASSQTDHCFFIITELAELLSPPP